MNLATILEPIIGILLCLNMGVLGYLVKRIWNVERKINNGLANTVAIIADRTKCLPDLKESVNKGLRETARVGAHVDGLAKRLSLLEKR